MNSSNQLQEPGRGKEVLLLGIEEVLGEAGLDVARLLLARLLARLRHLLPISLPAAAAAGRIRG
jgi:hypothetical protein